jgi:hypothetical protein
MSSSNQIQVENNETASANKATVDHDKNIQVTIYQVAQNRQRQKRHLTAI